MNPSSLVTELYSKWMKEPMIQSSFFNYGQKVRDEEVQSVVDL